MENCGHIFLDAEKNFKKTQVQTNLIWFRTFEASKSLEGVAKLDTIREQFV